MQADVFVQTEDCTPFEYIVKPLRDQSTNSTLVMLRQEPTLALRGKPDIVWLPPSAPFGWGRKPRPRSAQSSASRVVSADDRTLELRRGALVEGMQLDLRRAAQRYLVDVGTIDPDFEPQGILGRHDSLPSAVEGKTMAQGRIFRTAEHFRLLIAKMPSQRNSRRDHRLNLLCCRRQFQWMLDGRHD
jgi:hypothetical protein